MAKNKQQYSSELPNSGRQNNKNTSRRRTRHSHGHIHPHGQHVGHYTDPYANNINIIEAPREVRTNGSYCLNLANGNGWTVWNCNCPGDGYCDCEQPIDSPQQCSCDGFSQVCPFAY